MSTLKELEADYGASTKVEIIGLHEMQNRPRESFVSLIPPSPVAPRLSPCLVDRDVLVPFARDVLLQLDPDLVVFARDVLRERDLSPSD